MAATLRPETMYGQTNCWVLPDGEYGAYRSAKEGGGLGGEIFVMAARSARNLAWQEGLAVDAATGAAPLATVTGAQLLGTPLSVRLQYGVGTPFPLRVGCSGIAVRRWTSGRDARGVMLSTSHQHVPLSLAACCCSRLGPIV